MNIDVQCDKCGARKTLGNEDRIVRAARWLGDEQDALARLTLALVVVAGYHVSLDAGTPPKTKHLCEVCHG